MPGGCILPKLTMILAGLYPFGPIDLIPNRLPVVGHLDDVFIFCTGLLVATHLIPPGLVLDPSTKPDHDQPSRAHITSVQSFAWTLRGEILHALVIVTGRPLLRLVLDRWPTTVECRQFRLGLLNSVAPVPPLLAWVCCGRGCAGSAHPNDVAFLASRRRDLPRSNARRSRLLRPARRPLTSLDKAASQLPSHREDCRYGTDRLVVSPLSSAQIDPDPYRSMPPHVLTPFVPEPSRRFGGYPLIHGHYDLPALRRLGGGRTLMMVLREPRARLLSTYYYWRSIARKRWAERVIMHKFVLLRSAVSSNFSQPRTRLSPTTWTISTFVD